MARKGCNYIIILAKTNAKIEEISRDSDIFLLPLHLVKDDYK